ncbi:hypothetical protein Rcae01_02240 [Novipirellula caenicola]|uniref:Uncharacterized protein n=1 Tax=Novipirellula caenicola TaxID=1536901 RepID=A0ABP9VNL5_9BACT
MVGGRCFEAAAKNGVMYDSVSYFMGRRPYAGDSLLVAPVLFHCCWQGTVGG